MEKKSAEAFRTISEVAEWLGVPTHVLRFWESRFAQVKPVKRAGGRRYYRPSDMELLGGIRKLLHEDGMTIRGVQKLLRQEGVKHVAALSPPFDPAAETQEAMESNVVPLGAASQAADAAPEPESPAEPEPATPPDTAPDAQPDTALEDSPEMIDFLSHDADFPPEPEPEVDAEPAPDTTPGGAPLQLTPSDRAAGTEDKKTDSPAPAFGAAAPPSFLSRGPAPVKQPPLPGIDTQAGPETGADAEPAQEEADVESLVENFLSEPDGDAADTAAADDAAAARIDISHIPDDPEDDAGAVEPVSAPALAALRRIRSDAERGNPGAHGELQAIQTRLEELAARMDRNMGGHGPR